MTGNVFVIVQARMGSTRFPGKSMARICGLTLIQHLLAQISHCTAVDRTVLAIPDGPIDDALAKHAAEIGWTVFRGSEHDVLDRFFQAALANGAAPGCGIVRLTADDILPDPKLIDALTLLFKSLPRRFDYICTDRANRLPYGAGIELMSFEALARAHTEAKTPRDREHVVPYIKWNSNLFPSIEFTSSIDLSETVSLSIDTPEDLARVEKLMIWLGEFRTRPYSLADVLAAAEAALTPDSKLS